MERQIPELLLGITAELGALTEASRRMGARVQVLEALLRNIVREAGVNADVDVPMRAAVALTREEVLQAARAPRPGAERLDHVLLDVMNDVLEGVGLLEPPTGG